MRREPFLFLVLTIVMPFLLACQRESHPETTIDKQALKHSKSSGGVYTKLIRKSTNSPVSGELVFLDDTLILFTDRNRYVAIPSDDIASMTSQFTGTKAKTYLLITGLTLVPTVVGLLAHSNSSDSPKAIGLMATSPGLLVALVESIKKPQIMSYPEAPLEDFKKHARYPEVLPFDPKFQDLISSASLDIEKTGLKNTPIASGKRAESSLSIKKR